MRFLTNMLMVMLLAIFAVAIPDIIVDDVGAVEYVQVDLEKEQVATTFDSTDYNLLFYDTQPMETSLQVFHYDPGNMNYQSNKISNKDEYSFSYKYVPPMNSVGYI